MKSKQPNIVLIYTDNQQAATLGCYGNGEVHTPNIDALAAQAVTFNNGFCVNAYCSPSRGTLMTGLMPSQHGVHTWIDDRNMADWPANWYALQGHDTLPELLQKNGYRTALVGKYHLGNPETPMPGFDHWVTMADGHVRSFYRNRITENGTSYDHEGSSVDLFTERGISFIEDQAEAEQPFFLYLPYPAPYGHWPATREADRCRHSARYDDCPMASIPRRGLSRAAIEEFSRRAGMSGGGLDYTMLMGAPNDLTTLRNYYAQISMIDDGVGALMATLDRLGLSEDTVVIFSTDHGLSLGHHGFWGHGASTWPANMHYALHSIPMIIRDGGRAGVRSDAMVSNTDLFATVLDYAGIAMPTAGNSPSKSLRPLVSGQVDRFNDDAVYADQEETRVIRTSDWVYFKRFAGAANFPMEHALYHTTVDPEETQNLAGDPAYAEIEAQLDQRLSAYFDRYVTPQADLWSGGQPIQNTIRRAVWTDAWGDQWAPVYGYGEDAAIG